ncbi:enolase C-terminal domain-like protein [Streptosporangium canum]|uniref:enolase C-terminal domain-like protein n=1 Tax=Streptosporangium canum TaxID=324952 RepID=UPI0033ABB2FD
MTEIRAVRAAAYRVPTDQPEADGTLVWDATTLVVAEVDAEEIVGTRCGGYTGWFGAAVIAAAHHLQVSAHCAPNLHVPAATATANLRHIEWFHDHVRIEPELFDGAADPTGGAVHPRVDAPGHGLTLRPGAAAGYRVA